MSTHISTHMSAHRTTHHLAHDLGREAASGQEAHLPHPARSVAGRHAVFALPHLASARQFGIAQRRLRHSVGL